MQINFTASFARQQLVYTGPLEIFCLQLSERSRAGTRYVVAGGTEGRSLEPSGKSREWEGGEYEDPGGLSRICFKIYVSENAFQAILKPIFLSSNVL